jgi:hypothetical protein
VRFSQEITCYYVSDQSSSLGYISPIFHTVYNIMYLGAVICHKRLSQDFLAIPSSIHECAELLYALVFIF